MRPIDRKGRGFRLWWAAAVLLAFFTSAASAQVAERTNVTVVVKDAETGRPINQARLTLQFRETGKFGIKPERPHRLSYSAKTNPQGRYRFTDIPRGTIHLVVTAERHQTFGKEFEIDKANQLIEVALKKPQPLL
jgi:hypothetical protein